MMEINFVKIGIEVHYEPNYINCIPHWTKESREFYVSKEKYKKILDILLNED